MGKTWKDSPRINRETIEQRKAKREEKHEIAKKKSKYPAKDWWAVDSDNQ